MESESRFRQWLQSISDWVNEQEWFQQLKTKWEELDPQSRKYLQAGILGGGALLLLILFFSAVWSVHSLKSELAEKQDLLAQIQSANDELRRLKDESSGSPAAAGAAAGGNWSTFFESVAQTSGLDKAAMNVSGDKAGNSTDQSKESLYDIALKHVSIKQIVRFAFNVENGNRPVKLRNLSIDTHADPQGYMDASLAVSAFALINKQ